MNAFSLSDSAAYKVLAFLIGISLLVVQTAPIVALAEESSTATVPIIESGDSGGDQSELSTASFDLPGGLQNSSTQDGEISETNSNGEAIETENESMSMLSGGSDPSPTISNSNVFSFQGSQPKVDGATGALTQRVVLAIPPGRNGMQPDIALEYNSQQTEDGIAGYGWSISIPYIERLNKTGSQDLYNKPYYSSSVEGELATTSTATTSPYRARIDTGAYNSYSLSGNIWTVYDKKGTRYTYGPDAASRIESTSTPALTYRWMLQDVRDTNGNYIKYTYIKDNNQIYPHQIIYTGNGVTDGPITITFSTSTRPDPYISYKAGFNVTTKYRISQIQADVSGTWTHRYTLSYTTGNNGYRSLLSSIQQTGQDELANQLSLPPITFGYISTTTQFYKQSADITLSNQARVVADTDGNGRNDITLSYYYYPAYSQVTFISLNQQNSSSVSPQPPEYWASLAGGGGSQIEPFERGVRYLDVNADGKADIVKGLDDGSTTTRALYLNGYATSTGYSWTAATYSGTIPVFADSYTRGFFGDVNADGLPDYVVAANGVTKETSLGDGSAWDAASTTIFVAPQSISGPSGTVQNNSQLVDINGDGLEDWVYSDNSHTYVRLNNGRGWESTNDSRWTIATSTYYASGSSKYDRGMRFMDMNGDGLADFIRAYDAPVHNTGVGTDDAETGGFNYVMYNTGSGWTAPTGSMFSGTITQMQVQGCYPCTFYGQFAYNEFGNWYGNGQHPQDVLETIGHVYGATSTVSYERTTQSGSNAQLPISFLVVSRIITNDGSGIPSETTYTYSGGKMYRDHGVRDRKFAGFYKAVETKPNSVVTTYFSQGDSLATSTGEWSDGFGQINRPFREDITDLSGNVYQKTFYRWDSLARGNSTFVGLGQKIVQTFNGAASHKDTAETYTYSSTTNDLLEFDEYGEVISSIDGLFSNIDDDERATTFTYAASSSSNLVVPIEKRISKLDFATATSSATTTTSYNYLIVGGGGGGGGSWYNTGGGGGGAGGVKSGTASGLVFPGSYAVVTGVGGAGSGANATTNGGHGATSSFNGVFADGGGGGANGIGGNGSQGGSGGGAAGMNTGGAGTAGQGNNGSNTNHCNAAGSGGGAGAAATQNSSGGSGVSNSITGGAVMYGGGGGGGGSNCGGGGWLGGAGGGGAGGFGQFSYPGNPGTNGLGGGGGGGKDGQAGGNGGDGIVILSIPTSALSNFAVFGGVRTTVGTSSVFTFSSGGTLFVSATSTENVLTTLAQEKYTYDNLTYGSVNAGNPTKVEKWISGTTYASTTKTYNAYGLPTQEKDARSNTTSYTYDPLNVYVATSTNSLSQTVGYLYDYSSGKVKQATDENNRVFQTVFDALDRVTQEKQPDLTTPATLVVKNQYSYTDAKKAFAVQKTLNLNSATSTNTYQYLDGLGRTIQTRASTETSNQYAAKDTMYDAAGANWRESLPYFSTGADRTSPTAAGALYTTTLRDALGRLTAVGTAVGTTTNTYSNWTITTTDPLSNVKDVAKDAYGNISTVFEHIGSLVASTTYSWDSLGNLATTTDALGNVRGFAFDGLSRRTQAQDLHAPSDTAYGIWRFTYDLGNNVTQQIDPNNHTVNFAYDALNRVTSEDYTDGAGIEITYTYDICPEGKTRLCVVATPSATSSFAYNALGLTKSATTTASSTDYVVQYAYDRLGNVTDLVYPNNVLVSYLYNLDGQINSVQYRPSGGSGWSNIVRDLDYAPHGGVTVKAFASGATTTLAYDPAKLYRLSSIVTATTTIVSAAASSTNTHSLDFERSSSQYLSHSDASAYDVSGNLTIEAWVKVESNPANGEVYTIASKLHGGNMDRSYWLVYVNDSGTNKLLFSVADASANTDHKYFTQTLTPGTWYHIAAVYTAASSNFEVFVNGSSIGSQTGTLTAIGNSSTAFTVGMSYDNPGLSTYNFFDGMIDDVRVWNTARTATQIANNKGVELTGSESGLVAYYKLNNSYTDSTSGGNNMTAVNSPSFSTDIPSAVSENSTNNPIQDIAYVYDADGNILSITDESASVARKTVEYTYDQLNRLVSASTTAASSTPFLQSYTYNPIGNILDISNTAPATPNSWNYNQNFDALASATLNGQDSWGSGSNPGNFNVQSSIAYGGSGKAVGHTAWAESDIKRSVPAITSGTIRVRMRKEALNMQQGLRLLSGSTLLAHVFMGHNGGANKLGYQTGSSEIELQSFSASTWYTFDIQFDTSTDQYRVRIDEGAWTAWSNFVNNATASSVDTIQLSKGDGGTTALYWDGIGGLDTTGTTTGSYLYESTGYANPHAITQLPSGSGTTTFSYDNNGNVTQQTTGATTTTYVWDYRNRLTQVGSSGATTTFGYDYTGQRVISQTASSTTVFPSKYFSITSTQIASTTYASSTSYIYAGDTLVAYVEQDLIDSVATGTPRTFYVHPDHLGSTNAVSDENGDLVLSKDYLPFGSTRISSGDASLARGYIGQFESENLLYLQARYMDPARGQFMSQDPTFLALGNPNELRRLTQQEQMQFLADPQQLNSYSYARGNPIRFSDPTGNAIPAIVFFAGIQLIRFGSFAMTSYDALHYADTQIFPQYYSPSAQGDARTQAGYSGFLQVVGEFGSAKQQRALDVLGIAQSGLEYAFSAQQLDEKGNVIVGPRVNLSGSSVQTGSKGSGTSNSAYKYVWNPSTNSTGNNYSNSMTPRYNAGGSSGGQNNSQLISGLQSLVASLTKLISSLSGTR